MILRSSVCTSLHFYFLKKTQKDAKSKNSYYLVFRQKNNGTKDEL